MIVIDHGTKPITLQPAPNIEILKCSSDLWFSGAVNVGLRMLQKKVQADGFVMLLNDDVRLEDQNWLKMMIEQAGEDRVIACSAVDYEDRVVYAGLNLKPAAFRYLRRHQGDDIKKLGLQSNESDVLPTRGIIFPLMALEKVGLLNEKRLPQYGSDFEWSARAKKNGYKLFIVTNPFLRTEMNAATSTASGRNIYRSPKIRNFLRDFLNPHRNGNLYLIRNYSSLVFPFPYSLLYFGYHTMRKIGGFVLTNYIRNVKSP